MSDAEYYIQQQEEEARLQQASEYAASERNSKPLLCWTDQLPGEEVWSWQPLSKVSGVFAELYEQKQIGTEYFTASRIPAIDDESDWDDEEDASDDENEWDDEEDRSLQVDSADALKIVSNWKFTLVESEQVAIYEVLVVSRQDADRLRSEAVRQQAASTNLKQRMVAEMLEEMAAFINADSQSTVFVFARMV